MTRIKNTVTKQENLPNGSLKTYGRFLETTRELFQNLPNDF